MQDTGRIFIAGCSGDDKSNLPCWPCYRDGFRSQNPEEPANDDYADEEPEVALRRSEPADFGGGESTGVQDL